MMAPGPTPSSASGELWGATAGHNAMPLEVDMDCMLPNGILICLRCNRDTSLKGIKEDLWKEARKFPLFRELHDPSNYVLSAVSLSGEVDELYDESRKLCDLRLFSPTLKLVEPVGNREEKQLVNDIGLVLDRPLNEIEASRDSEVHKARLHFYSVASSTVALRVKNRPFPGRDVFCLARDNILSLQPHTGTPDILICLWVKDHVGPNLGGQKSTLKASVFWTPRQLIAEILKVRTRRKLSFSSTMGTTCNPDSPTESPDDYLLKVGGDQLYLLDEVPIFKYQYIHNCISETKTPQIMLMSRDLILNALPSWDMVTPSYVRRQPSNSPETHTEENTASMWEYDSMFRIKLNGASYINASEYEQIYVRVAIFHGPEQLAVRCSDMVSPRNPRWSQVLEFDIAILDIPHAAQICFSLCSVIKRKRDKEDHCALAWGNMRLIDHTDKFLDTVCSLHLWPFPKGFEGYLNPLGHNGSNPIRDSPKLDFEFENLVKKVTFPPRWQIKELVQNMQQWMKSEKRPIDPKVVSKTESDIFESIKNRDPLHEMLEEEKETMWRLRNYCKLFPDSLPRLLDSVKWSSREEVAEVYVLLDSWPPVLPETAMELLDIKYPDQDVRRFAVSCLDATLTDDQLELYLMSLVQVLKYEPFVNNELSVLLLQRALRNQRIGHLFFWLLRAEMSHYSNWMRFALLLEAFCRGCGPYLQSLLKQVASIRKLEDISGMIKESKEESNKLLAEELKHNQNVLQDLESPLDSRDVLGSLLVEECKVMGSAKKPLWLVWQNPDPLADILSQSHEIIFKNGDDLRQDMLTLQVFRIMDSIWKAEGRDFQLTPYACLPMGKRIGMIEVVKKSKTIGEIQKQSRIGALNVGNLYLNKWIKDRNKGSERYEEAVQRFTYSCAGYCVATFVLGIKDRHQDNIMVTEDGKILHIDFGHFLGHYKKKFGISRERVPFVLTDLYVSVINKGALDNAHDRHDFIAFTNLCVEGYKILHKHARLFITLFTMMLCMDIPELQRLEDIAYLRRTLAADLSEEEAVKYFVERFKEAYEGAWKTNVDWIFHGLKHL